MTLFERTLAAMAAHETVVESDSDLGSIVLGLGGRTTVVMVLDHLAAVVAYQVWEEPVASERIEAVAELVTRANGDLYTAALELDLDAGVLAARSGVRATSLDAVPDEVFARMLLDVVEDARVVAGRLDGAVQHVLGGGTVADALAPTD